jgi:hypothetical protein
MRCFFISSVAPCSKFELVSARHLCLTLCPFQQLPGDLCMPELSRFLGIIIAMFYKDHAPPHFHSIYGEYEITVEIESGVINGRFPRRALRLVLEWLELHKDELLENWQLAEENKPLKKIAPLE